MNLTLSQNMIYYIVIIVITGKALKPMIKKKRKTILPLILMAFGVCLAFAVGKLNGSTQVGNDILQGLISSIVAQFGFDKVKDMTIKGLDDVWKT